MAAPFKVQQIIGMIFDLTQAILFELTVIKKFIKDILKNFVSVNLSNSKISKINRIHTSITSKWAYARLQGSNNVVRWPGQPMEFEVFLRMEDITVQHAQDADIILYYQVEGTCA